MLTREKLHLLPALLVSVECNQSPVTYVVLSLRLCGLGGDRACRATLDELVHFGFIELVRQSGVGDGREKTVMVTDAGFAALRRYHEIVGDVITSRPKNTRFERSHPALSDGDLVGAPL